MANGCESHASFSCCVFLSHCCFQRWREESYVLYVLLKKVYWVWIPLGTLQFIFYRYVFTKFLFQRKIAPISSPSRKKFNVRNNVNEFESCDALSLNLLLSYPYLQYSYTPHTFGIILSHTERLHGSCTQPGKKTYCKVNLRIEKMIYNAYL